MQTEKWSFTALLQATIPPNYPKLLQDRDRRIRMLREFIDAKKTIAQTQPLLLIVQRNNIVESILNAFEQKLPLNIDMLRPVMVMFENETVIDVGGASRDMYTNFFQAVLVSAAAFFCNCSVVYISTSARRLIWGRCQHKWIHSLPTCEGNQWEPGISSVSEILKPFSCQFVKLQAKQLELFGRVLLKCFLDHPAVCSFLPPSLFRFLLFPEDAYTTVEEALADVSAYSKAYANSMQQLLNMTDEQLTDLALELPIDGKEVGIVAKLFRSL